MILTSWPDMDLPDHDHCAACIDMDYDDFIDELAYFKEPPPVGMALEKAMANESLSYESSSSRRTSTEFSSPDEIAAAAARQAAFVTEEEKLFGLDQSTRDFRFLLDQEDQFLFDNDQLNCIPSDLMLAPKVANTEPAAAPAAAPAAQPTPLTPPSEPLATQTPVEPATASVAVAVASASVAPAAPVPTRPIPLLPETARIMHPPPTRTVRFNLPPIEPEKKTSPIPSHFLDTWKIDTPPTQTVEPAEPEDKLASSRSHDHDHDHDYVYDHNIDHNIDAPPSRRRSKAFLVDDYLDMCIPGDGVYEQLIQDCLIPYCQFNYLDLEFFKQLRESGQVQDSFIYERNYKSNVPLCEEDDPGRFSGSNGNLLGVNFYEPRVFRWLPVKEFKKQGREGLCPYCIPPDDPTKEDIDALFFNLNSSAYLHHVTKQHGVYSNGSEMPLPIIMGSHQEARPMKTGTRVTTVDVVTCPVCNEKVKIQRFDDRAMDGHNRFLGYFRHMLKHNLKKNNGRAH